jgi:hypothetical protein
MLRRARNRPRGFQIRKESEKLWRSGAAFVFLNVFLIRLLDHEARHCLYSTNMSAKAIREIDGKLLLTKHIKYEKLAPNPIVSVTKSTSLQELARHNPFLMRDRLVVKPDQLIKRRGKLGLIKVNADFNGVGQWLGGMMGKEIQVSD